MSKPLTDDRLARAARSLRNAKRARPHITNTTRPVRTEGGTELLGVKPLIIAYVIPTKRWVKDFLHRCKAHGLNARCVDDVRFAFEVTGTPEALELLTSCRCIHDWHYPLSARVPMIAAGTGDEPVRTRSRSKEPNRTMTPAQEVAARRHDYRGLLAPNAEKREDATSGA